MSTPLYVSALAALLLVCLGVADTTAQAAPRTQTSLNEGWSYLPDAATAPASLPADSGWEPVTLPHTWNRWDVMDPLPGYRRDASWYRRTLEVEPAPGQSHALYFEGANVTTDVYVDGERAGGHVGGYVGFEVDLTDVLADGGTHELLVRVDNGYDPNVIPSQKADFFIYGGIARDLWLVTRPAQGLGHLVVSTPEVSAQQAVVEVAAFAKTGDVFAKADLAAGNTVSVELLERPGGRVVAEASVAADRADPVRLELANPRLWSPASPNLYTVRTRLLDDAGAVLDELSEPLGLRWFEFADHGAFSLNGEPLLLRGTHRHEEHAGYGAAMPDSLHRRDIEQLKEMGANFLRLGHYPQDPEVYRACDELGILVWDELPWCRGGIGGDAWRANTKRLLTEQIEQNRSHPSVIIWSVGNEIYWLPDFPGGDDETELNAFVGELNDLAHELDPSRLTAIRKYYPGAGLVDVFSPSIWSGWYAGTYDGYGPAITEAQAEYPHFLHMEYGGSSHVGRHTEESVDPLDGTSAEGDQATEVANQVDVVNVAQQGDWTESYIVDLFDHYLTVQETQPDFAGAAQWAFKDFGTPLRPENAIPYVNQKGLVDRAGKPKDAYYVFKSYWAEEPFAYIESHTWTERSGPEGVAKEVAVYSNADRVELFHQGESLGERTKTLGELPAQGLHWEVSFAEGANTLLAQAYRDDALVATDSITVDYSFEDIGTADRIELTSEPYSDSTRLVVATAVDTAGHRVLDYERNVYFDLNGAAELLANYGTPTRSQIIQMANGRASIEVRPSPGRSVIECRNQDFKGSYLTLPADGLVRSAGDADTSLPGLTQAVLLTQEAPFVLAAKDTIAAPYKARTRVEVPRDLAPQNKWVMFEGPVLENERIAYRFYLDSRHRTDIYGKRVAALVMDTVGWDYHDVMDWGADILKVGDALGVGAPGIVFEDSIYTFSDHGRKVVEVTANGGARSAFRFTWDSLRIGDRTVDVVQDWSLAAGEDASDVTVRITRGELPPGAALATGIVRHGLPATVDSTGSCIALYTFGKQSIHDEQLGMAVVAPLSLKPRVVDNGLSYVLAFDPLVREVSYRFLAGWERGVVPVRTADRFRQLSLNACTP